MKVGVYGQVVKLEDKELLQEFFKKLEEKNVTILVYDIYINELKTIISYENSGFVPFSKEERVPKDTDFLFTFGGDGTILSAVTFIKDLDVPIVGVNTGRLGFLATIQKTEILKELPSILSGQGSISERALLEIRQPSSVIDYPYAVNEVTVMRTETSAMITVDAFVDEAFLNTFWADGLIVATPTGSTGYSLSCGGPIIYPQADIFSITPIAPHNLNVRPLILKDDVNIKLKINSRSSQYSLSLDSRFYTLNVDEEIIIKKADFKIKIVQYKDYSYFENLHHKLHWGTDSRN